MSATAAQADWVARVLGVRGPVESAPLSLVRLGKARLGWRNDRGRAVAEIGRFRAAVLAEFGDDDEQAGALGAALARLDRLVGQLDGTLDERLDAVLNESDPDERATLRRDAVSALDRFETLIAGDPILLELDGNELLPDMNAVGPLRRRLAEIAAALG